MAVLKVEFDNILCFNNFEANFLYPKKVVGSHLENEFFQNYPKLRYKKVNILVGPNASGKTSLGKAIWKTMSFISNRESASIRSLISDPTKDAYILMDCAFEYGSFFRFEAKLLNNEETLVRFQEIDMDRDDTYKTLVSRLDDKKPFINYVEALETGKQIGWNFNFPSIETGGNQILSNISENEFETFLPVLEAVLKTFDNSVEKVFISSEQENTYIVKFFNGNTQQIKKGDRISNLSYLSSGTKYAVNIANVLYSIMNHENGFYFIDEQFSYVNSDLEIACLTTMANMLDDGEQLFFTTHNTELLSLPFPNHTFSFIRKTQIKDKVIITLDDASQYEKRNNVNIKNLYDNNYFNVAPDVSKIFGVNKE